MKWAKLATEFLFDLSDKEICAAAKYVMLRGLKEREPTARELARTLSAPQREIVRNLLPRLSQYFDSDKKIVVSRRKKMAEIYAKHKNSDSQTDSQSDTSREEESRIDVDAEASTARARQQPRPSYFFIKGKTNYECDELLNYARKQSTGALHDWTISENEVDRQVAYWVLDERKKAGEIE